MAPQAPSLALTLAQRQVPLAYLTLLPSTAVQLEDIVARAIMDNPMLTRSPGGPCLGCGRHCRSAAFCAACSLERVNDAVITNPADWRTALAAEARLELPADLHGLLARVVDSLDDRGLLPRSGEDSEALTRVLSALRLLGPPGIAARSPADCVRIQVVALAATGDLPPWAGGLTLAELIAALNGDGPDRVSAILPDIVRRVTPYVALPDGGRIPPPPDVSYRRTADGDVMVEVMNTDWFGLALDDAAWTGTDREGRTWLAPYRVEARRLLAAVDARAGLLRRLAVWLGTTQQAFLFNGNGCHRPLTRAEAARALGHHPATIGRIVAGKTARCPDGRLVPLAACFGGRTAALEELSVLAGNHPDASDARLAELLTASGHPTARRTVSKYRTLLGIPARR